MNTISRLQAYALAELSGIYDEDETRFLCAVVFEKFFRFAKIDIHLRKHEALPVAGVNKFVAVVAALRRGEPIQYVLGEAVFAGLVFKLNKDTLIPRPETEELVEWVAGSKGSRTGQRGLDVGTGCGCVAVALATRVPGMTWEGVDVAAGATRAARVNARTNGARVSFMTRDFTLFRRWEWPVYDLIVSNPPYVRVSERATMHDRVALHEPHRALFVPDDDALLFYRVIGEFGRQYLAKGGELCFVVYEALAGEVAGLLEGMGYGDAEVRRDLFGKDRMVRCSR
ncbi:MAG: peptide chain release factor N(5)-glutamine methyltransferase [Odoribacteraceae bacterium]|jgi:release factor glutamine methyltransferase|nr:peptide chain release factor N(5)-glutamine methyltransferase [Odoribacteraceae bacterium]